MHNFFITLYYCWCVVYVLLSIWRKRGNSLIKSIYIIFFPGLGFFLTMYLFKQRKSGLYSQVENNEREGMMTQLPQTIRRVNVQSETNYVPIQDALLLNDNKIKRKLLIHSLKENAVQNTNILKNALQNEDSETSHYAAAAIMEMNRKMLNAIHKLSAKLEEKADDINTMLSYAVVIKEYLSSGFLDDETQLRYKFIFSDVLEGILEGKKGTRQQFIDKISCDLELNHHDKARYYSELFMMQYPLDEEAYIMAMKLHYALNNTFELKKVITRLKEQPIYLSAKTLNFTEYWA